MFDIPIARRSKDAGAAGILSVIFFPHAYDRKRFKRRTGCPPSQDRGLALIISLCNISAMKTSPLVPRAEWHSRGKLPHWEAGEAAQAITFGLADALPRAVVKAILSEALPVQRRERFEALFDAGRGAAILGDPGAARIVQDAFLHFDARRYRLHAWCIMPNHVHVLITPNDGVSLSAVIHSWKSLTANAINAALDRTGALWREEFFDRAIRSDEHYANTLAYIENNPVKAGLAAAAEDWPWSSASREAPPGTADFQSAC